MRDEPFVASRRPGIESVWEGMRFMGEQPSLALLTEALRREQRLRWQAGEQIPAETYLQQHPELQNTPDYALELIYHEVVLRQEQGEAVPLEEYLQRFPQFAP